MKGNSGVMLGTPRVATKAQRNEVTRGVSLLVPFDSESAEESDVVNIQCSAVRLRSNSAIHTVGISRQNDTPGFSPRRPVIRQVPAFPVAVSLPGESSELPLGAALTRAAFTTPCVGELDFKGSLADRTVNRQAGDRLNATDRTRLRQVTGNLQPCAKASARTEASARPGNPGDGFVALLAHARRWAVRQHVSSEVRFIGYAVAFRRAVLAWPAVVKAELSLALRTPSRRLRHHQMVAVASITGKKG